MLHGNILDVHQNQRSLRFGWLSQNVSLLVQLAEEGLVLVIFSLLGNLSHLLSVLVRLHGTAKLLKIGQQAMGTH